MTWRSQIEELYRKHGAELVLFATSFTNDRFGAQDAVQQVFLNMLDRQQLVVAEPRAYLYRAVRNTVLNAIKLSGRQTELPEDPWFFAPSAQPERELTLRSALRELPQEQRELVVMHVWGGLTCAEIAHVADISVNTATSRYRYALANLREFMTRKTHVRTG